MAASLAARYEHCFMCTEPGMSHCVGVEASAESHATILILWPECVRWGVVR